VIYLMLKASHIFSITLLFGMGLGSVFYKWMGDRSGDVSHIAVINRHVVLADWLVTTPMVFYQPISGAAMMHLAGIPLSTPWLATSIVLYLIVGLCWLPVVWLQIQMRDMAELAVLSKAPLPQAYWRLSRIWFWLGVPAFILMVAVIVLMVVKPALW